MYHMKTVGNTKQRCANYQYKMLTLQTSNHLVLGLRVEHCFTAATASLTQCDLLRVPYMVCALSA